MFDIEDMVIFRPFQRVAPVVVEATEDDMTGVAGIALFGELLDHLSLDPPIDDLVGHRNEVIGRCDVASHVAVSSSSVGRARSIKPS